MARHRENWVKQQKEQQPSSRSASPYPRPPSPPPDPLADMNAPTSRGLAPPALQMPVPNLFSNAWSLQPQASAVAMGPPPFAVPVVGAPFKAFGGFAPGHPNMMDGQGLQRR